jgi:hypothetical protein
LKRKCHRRNMWDGSNVVETTEEGGGSSICRVGPRTRLPRRILCKHRDDAAVRSSGRTADLSAQQWALISRGTSEYEWGWGHDVEEGGGAVEQLAARSSQ